MRVSGEPSPVGFVDLDLNFGAGKDVFDYHRIGIAVRHHGGNVTFNTEGLENRFVEWQVAALGPNQRPIDVKENELFHRLTDICTTPIGLANR